MRFCRLWGVSAIILFALVDVGEAQADPRGLWLAHDGATVRVTSCGKGLCATMASPKSQVDPSTGQPWTDKNNPDPMKRGRPLVGVEIFSLLPDGAGKWSGSLYNTDDGRTYPGHLLEINERTIRVEGCGAIGICGGQNMSRIQ
jgi:uncharacterized protein (DUF2147 family)